MNIQNILYSLPGIIIGLTIHEYCHALAAYKLGDSTARDQGRMTFNPVKHLDPIGSLFIIFAGFGWAKPVQFNPANLTNLRRDKAIIAAAGPLSNLLLALVFIGIIRLWLTLAGAAAPADSALTEFLRSENVLVFVNVVLRAAVINIGLFVFNLLPIPPLDGSHIAFSGLNLPMELQFRIMRIGMPLLFGIIIIQNFANITILPIRPLVTMILHFFLPQLAG
ncbi:MAG: site-2 protease family protein [Treponema sp.]|nr:site-2 protease family protein [Treponema sp.]